jgi:hypothetical protein
VSVGQAIVVVIGSLAVIAFLLWMLLRRRDPEDSAGHPQPPRTGSAQFHGDPDDRPAGPGAEDDGVGAPGQPAPGPSAESPGPP